jgi:uncharacterized membrane protein
MFDGFWLGAVVMGILVAALLYALIQAIRSAVFGHTVPSGPSWADSAILVLALAGIGVAAYLAYVETSQVAAVCGPVGDCNEVQASPYARLLGVPVGVIGLLGYGAIVAAWAAWRFTGGTLARLAPLAIFAMALFGVLFSIYLTYIELGVILAICIWCLTSAVVMAAILVLATGPALSALTGGEAEQ